MVSSRRAGRLASYAMLASSMPGTLAANGAANYKSDTLAAAQALQTWYDPSTGCYTTTGWWICANCLTVLADWAMLDPAGASIVDVPYILSTSFTNAKATNPSKRSTAAAAAAVVAARGAAPSRRSLPSQIRWKKRDQRWAVHPEQYADAYYDDDGWWALAWIRAYDAVQVSDPQAASKYLLAAQGIFDIMTGGVDNTCNGGIWWSTARAYKNAIANALYLSVAASLAVRIPDNSTFLDTARRQWDWFKASGMINAQNLINDGLSIGSNGTCFNNGQNTWSYNQGVILGGLVELSRATGDKSYLAEAATIAKAAIADLSNPTSGVIHESGGCDETRPDSCGVDGTQFKGIFVRNLGYLQQAAPDATFSNSILANAQSIWKADRNASNDMGDNWAEYYGTPDASTQASAMNVLVAAIQAAECTDSTGGRSSGLSSSTSSSSSYWSSSSRRRSRLPR